MINVPEPITVPYTVTQLAAAADKDNNLELEIPLCSLLPSSIETRGTVKNWTITKKFIKLKWLKCLFTVLKKWSRLLRTQICSNVNAVTVRLVPLNLLRLWSHGLQNLLATLKYNPSNITFLFHNTVSTFTTTLLLVYSTVSEVSKHAIIFHILGNQCLRILPSSHQQAFSLFWADNPV